MGESPGAAAFVQLAEVYVRQGQYAAAVGVCERGLAVRPDFADGHRALGRALRGLERYGPASEHLGQSLILAPDDRPTYLELTEVLMCLDRFTEALAVVDEAIARWPDDALLRGMRDRTSEGQTGEATAVRATPRAKSEPPPVPSPLSGGGGSGAGSTATAGPREDEESTRVRTVSNPPGSVAEPSATAPPGPLQPGLSDPGVGWNDVDDRWADVLDARGADSPGVEPHSELREPVASARSLDVELPPLSHPLAAGMPPLPEDPAGAGRPGGEPKGMFLGSAGGDSGAPGGRISIEEETLTVAGAPGYEADILTPPVHPAEVRAMLPQGEAAELDLPGQAEPLAAPVTTPPAAQTTGEPAQGAPFFDEGAETVRREFPGRQAMDRVSEVAQAPRSAQAQPARAPLAKTPAPARPSRLPEMGAGGRGFPPGPGGGDGGTGPGAKRPWRRRLVAVVALLALALLGGVGAWWFVRGDRLEANAQGAIRRAKMVCTAAEAVDAARAVRRVSSLRPAGSLEQQVALVRAMAWLCEGAPKPSAAHSRPSLEGGAWTQRAVGAALALAAGDPAVALGQLEAATAADPLDMAIQAALLAWTAWLGNRPQDALQWAKAALGRSQLLSLAWLVQGHVYREIGQLEQAAASYQELVQRYPGHRPARLALAELRSSAPPADSPVSGGGRRGQTGLVVSSWGRLIEAERTWRTVDEAAGKSRILAAVTTAPLRREVLVYGMRLLGETRQYAAAEAVVARLTPKGAAEGGGGSGIQQPLLLQAELASYRGADASALGLLEQADIPSAYYQRQRVWAALHSMRFGRARELLAQTQPRLDDGSAAILALAFRPKGLDEMAKARPIARFAGAVGLGRRGQCSQVDALVTDLAEDAELGPRAAVLLGRCSLHRGDYAQARNRVAGLEKQSAGFLPPRELTGEIGVALGVTVEVIDTLEAVHAAGCRTAAGILALTHGYLDLGWVSHAEQSIQTAESVDAPPAGLAAAKAHLALAQGKPVRAMKLLDAVKRSTFEGLLVRAQAAMKLRRFEVVEGALVAARGLRPEDAHIALLRARSLVLQRDRDSADELARVVAQAGGSSVFKRSTARAHLLLARVEAQRRRRGRLATRERVLAQLNLAVVADPDYWRAWRRLGRHRLKYRQWSKAREAFERSLKLNPRDAGALYWLARACRADLAGKEAALRRLLELETEGWRAKRARRILASLAAKK